MSGAHFAAHNDSVTVTNGILLADSRIHELEGPAAVGFALAAMAHSDQTVFWIGRSRAVTALRKRGLRTFIDDRTLITVQTANRSETLWAAEEALRCTGSGLVVLQVDLGPNLNESRRLQVAAQAGHTLGLIVIGRRAQSSAAQSRWHCEYDPTRPDGWVWRMTKNRQGQLSAFDVHLDLPTTLAWPPDLVRRPSDKKGSLHALTRITAIPRRLVSAASA